jgi:hypothetical protein
MVTKFFRYRKFTPTAPDFSEIVSPSEVKSALPSQLTSMTSFPFERSSSEKYSTFSSQTHMKSIVSLFTILPSVISPLFIGGLLLTALDARAETAPAMIDDFSVAEHLSSGLPRMIITDKEAGGSSAATQAIAEGKTTVTGSLKPGRGMPAFVSLPLILTADNSPSDLSAYEGIRLIVHVATGNLSIQISSTVITNFDYHTSQPITRDSKGLNEVRIPFSAMKRIWSAQTALNLKEVTSINLVSASMAPASFAYTIDEIGLY